MMETRTELMETMQDHWLEGPEAAFKTEINRLLMLKLKARHDANAGKVRVTNEKHQHDIEKTQTK